MTHRTFLDKLLGRNKFNNKSEGITLLESEIAKKRKVSYADLKAKIGQEPETFELTGASGIEYQFEFTVHWDDKKPKRFGWSAASTGAIFPPTLP